MRRASKLQLSLHIGDLVPFSFTVALSLVLGLLIPDDRHSLIVALLISGAGALLVLAAWPSVWHRWPSLRSARPFPAARGTNQVPARPYLVPRELPPAPSSLFGRDKEVADLLYRISRGSDVDNGPFIAAICGGPGIGKSALALTVAHKAAASFRDGQVFVQMRGGRDQAPEAGDLIEHFVTALKGPTDDLAPSLGALKEQYAALTKRYSVLFVLDDVAPTINISAIRPDNPKCAIIVTCRGEPDWPGVSYHRVRLDPLEAPDAISMLRATVGGDRPSQEEQPYLRRLATQCGGEPLALRAAGTALADRPNWDIRLITRQASSAFWAPALEHSRIGIFDAAYALLTTDEQRALRVLGTLQIPDFAPWMIAVALQVSEDKGHRLASRLTDASLIERYNPGSGTPLYRAEEPIMRYARLRADADESPEETRRWRQLFEDERDRRRKGSFNAEIGSLDELLQSHGGFRASIQAVRHAMSLARERDSSIGVASACAALAELYTDLGDIVAAEDLAQQAIEVEDTRSRARSYRCLTRLERRRHRLGLAIQHADHALRYASQAGDRAEQARILVEKAVVVASQGEPEKADEICAEAVRICEELKDAAGSLRVGVRWCQGRVWLHAGRYDEAARILEEGKRMAEDLREERLGAWIDHTSAGVALATGNAVAAERYALDGLDAFTTLRHRYGMAHCRHRLGQIRMRQMKVADAIRLLQGALESFHNCGDIWIESEASLDLADAYRRNGQIRVSLQMQRVARRAYRQLGRSRHSRRANWLLVRTLLACLIPRRSHPREGARPELA
jgi:tetratricopeptide (TPR) repeat protein